MKNLTMAILIAGGICSLSPAFACDPKNKKPHLTRDEICGQLKLDLVKTNTKLRFATFQLEKTPHAEEVKFNRDLYEIQDSMLRGIINHYCWE